MARLSELSDAVNKLSIAAVIAPKNIYKRRHTHELFLNLMPCELALLNRGCPAFWLFKAILTIEANFCARIEKRWKVVRQFLEFGLDEQIATLSASRFMEQVRPGRKNPRKYKESVRRFYFPYKTAN